MEEPADLENPQTWLDMADLRMAAVRNLIINGFYDDAVSRAYYAMYYAAKAGLLTIGVKVKKHSSTFALINDHFVRTGLLEKKYISLLGRAQRARERSDYTPAISTKESEANLILNDAETFIIKMKEIVNSARKQE